MIFNASSNEKKYSISWQKWTNCKCFYLLTEKLSNKINDFDCQFDSG